MKRKNKKPTNRIDWLTIVIAGVVDLVVGSILIALEKLLG